MPLSKKNHLDVWKGEKKVLVMMQKYWRASKRLGLEMETVSVSLCKGHAASPITENRNNIRLHSYLNSSYILDINPVAYKEFAVFSPIFIS